MQQQTILITGASSGIGLKTASIAIAHGHRVIATAPNDELLKSVPDDATMKLAIDIRDQSSINEAISRIQAADISLTCLINNAGFAQPGPIELVDDKMLREQFDVNFFGTLAMTRAVLPLLRAQSTRGITTRIITLSSMLGLVSLPFQGAYAASKHALEAAFESLRMELADSGTKVILIEPGWISSDFLRTSLSKAPKEWLEHSVYGEPLSNYFKMSQDAESSDPRGPAKIASAMAGTTDQVAKVILTALETEHPKARYPVTSMAKWMPRLAFLLPTKVWDKIHTQQSHS